MSANDGKALEDLVKQIEEQLSPAGWTVSSRLKPRDDEGNQLAEFAITLEGPIGSSSVKWLIECRDRQEPAPGSWIEQLYGRKMRFDFDRVFAVSTSGFSPAAIDACQRLNVSRREIHSVPEIATDYQIEKATWVVTEIREPGTLEYRDPKTNDAVVANTEGMRLKRPGEDAFRPLSDHVFAEVRDLSHPQQQHPTWSIAWTIPGPVQLLLGDGTVVEAESPHATFIVKILITPLQAITSRVYEEEGRVIAAEASIEIDSEAAKAVVLCRLSYDQASDTWIVTSVQTGGPSRWTPAPNPVRVPGSTLKTTFEAVPKGMQDGG